MNFFRSRAASAAVIAVAAVAACLVLGVVPAASAAPVGVIIDGISYSADDANFAAGATVTDYTPGPTDVVIPATVEIDSTVYPVTSIGGAAFLNKALTSVVIPNSVTTIGNDAFAFNNLTSVTISNSVTTIGQDAFIGNALTSVTIPNSVTTIGNDAFFDNALTSVTFLGAAPTLGASVFSSDPLLTYFWRYGSPQAVGGFTTPGWNGYRTQPVAQVVFDAGGSTPAPAEQQKSLGDVVVEPTDPTRTGYVFQGWFTAATGGSAWDFTDQLSDLTLAPSADADLTLYAQWAAPALADTGVDPALPMGAAALLLLLGAAALRLRPRAAPGR